MQTNPRVIGIKYILVILLFWFSAVPSALAKIESQAQMLELIDSMYSQISPSPIDDLKTLAVIIEQANNNNWQIVFLSAATLRMELLSETENIEAMQNEIYDLISLADKLAQNDLLIRLETSELFVREILGPENDMEAQHQKILLKAMTLENSALAGRVLLDLGISQYNVSNYADAIKTLKLSYQAFEEAGISTYLPRLLSSLGNINGDLHNVEIAIKYFQEALQGAKNQNDTFQISIILYNMGNVYHKDNQYLKARTYMLRAMEVSHKLEDVAGVVWAQGKLAEIHFALEEWQQAIDLFSIVVPFFKENGNVKPQFYALNSEALAYLEMKMYEECAAKLKIAGVLVDKIDVPFVSWTFKRSLMRLEQAKGNYEKAFNILMEITDLKSKMVGEEQSKLVEKYRIEFDSEINERKNESLAIENELKSTKILQQESQRLIWIIVAVMGSAFAILLVVLLYMQTRNRNFFRSIALIDGLTSAPNRRAILNHLELKFAEAKRKSTPLTIGLIDIDLFKKFNDEYGHKVGDEVLIAFATAFRKSLREYDAFGRYGGEEWLVVFADIEHSTIESIFKRLRSNLQLAISENTDIAKNVTFSMGVASFDKGQDKDHESIINRADKNLYIAKNGGRNRFID